jgi:RNA polymerase sigma-70 factor (ECF subfamily)
VSTELPLSFDLLYQDYSLRVYRWAYRLLRHQQAAEDATQETFLRAWRYLGHFDPTKGALSSWLYRMTVQVIRNQQSHSQWHDATVSLDHILWDVQDREVVDPQVRYEENAGQLAVALEALPHHERLAILLRASGYREVEIGRVVGRTSRTVRTWLASGRKQLVETVEGAR